MSWGEVVAAVEAGDVHTLETAVENGGVNSADPDQISELFSKAFDRCKSKNFADVVEFLIDVGATLPKNEPPLRRASAALMSARPEERVHLKQVIRAVLRGSSRIIATEVAPPDPPPMKQRLEDRKRKLSKRREAAKQATKIEEERAAFCAAAQKGIDKALGTLEGGGGVQAKSVALQLTPKKRTGMSSAASAAATAAAAAMVASHREQEQEVKRRREEKKADEARVAKAKQRASAVTPTSEDDDDFHSAESGGEEDDLDVDEVQARSAPPAALHHAVHTNPSDVATARQPQSEAGPASNPAPPPTSDGGAQGGGGKDFAPESLPASNPFAEAESKSAPRSRPVSRSPEIELGSSPPSIPASSRPESREEERRSTPARPVQEMRQVATISPAKGKRRESTEKTGLLVAPLLLPQESGVVDDAEEPKKKKEGTCCAIV